MSEYRTIVASLDDYVKGGIEVINDSRKNYAFSNVYEVAANAAPYEKVVVGRNLQYVIETLRAEGSSSWFTAAHDEFALVMDGDVAIDFIKLDDPHGIAPPDSAGSIELRADPVGRKMGWVRLGRGHQALLPRGAAYRFRAPDRVGVIVLQTILGRHSVQKWADICLT